MSNTRPPTPAAVAYQLRREAAFGCCVCGNPIVQYHHIVPYAVEPHFRPEDMMALCPNHHDEANSGAMTARRQRRYKAEPYNHKRGFAQGLLTITGQALTAFLGGNTFSGGGP